MVLVDGVAMSDYRQMAQECLRAAEKMCSPAARIEMMHIAGKYVVLAGHADRNAKGTSDIKEDLMTALWLTHAQSTV
jgi:hypothetical protein